MVTIREKLRQIERAKSQAREVQSSIPKTTQRQLRGQTGRKGLEGREFQRKLRTAREKVNQFIDGVTAQETNLQAFLRTKEGKIRYAREQGLQGKKIKGRLGKGYAIETLAIEYDTPYGRVVDTSPKEKALAREREFINKSTPEEIKSYFKPQLDKFLETGKEGSITIRNVVGDFKFRVSRSADRTNKIKQSEELKNINQAVASFNAPTVTNGNVSNRLPNRLNTGENVRIRSKQSNPSFLSGLTSGFKDETKEAFSSETGLFVRADTPRRETITSRPPTFQEKFIIDEAKRKGSLAGLTETASKISDKGNRIILGEKAFREMKRNEPNRTTLRDVKEKFPPLKVFDVGAEGILRVGEKLGGGRIPQGERRIAKDIISTGLMSAGFEPLVRTATAQKSEFIYDNIRGRFIKKKDLSSQDFEDFFSSPEKKGSKVTVLGRGLSNYNIKAERVNRLLASAQTPAQRQAILNEARLTYGDSFLKEFASQEGLSFAPPRTNFLGEQNPLTIQTAELRGVSGIKTAVSNNRDFQVLSDTRQKQDLFFDTKTKQSTSQDSATRQDSRNFQLLSTNLRNKTTQTIIRPPRQTTKQRPLQIFGVASKTRQTTQTIIRPPRQTTKQPPRQPPRRPRIPKFPILPSSQLQRLAKKVEQEPELFKVFGRRFGVFQEVGVAKTKKKAERKLESFLKGTLGRSGFLSSKGAKVQSSLLRQPSFRQGKKDPFLVVQRRKASLSSPLERREINYFRNKKTKNKQKKNIFF